MEGGSLSGTGRALRVVGRGEEGAGGHGRRGAAVPEGGEELDHLWVDGVGLERSSPLLARAVGACLAGFGAEADVRCARAGVSGYSCSMRLGWAVLLFRFLFAS